MSPGAPARPSRVLLVGMGIGHRQAVSNLEPLGIACVGAWLRAHGYEVRLHHVIGPAIDDLLALVGAWKPEVVGFSCYTSNWAAGRDAARRVRGLFAGPIVFGGIHATLNPGIALEESVDYAVRGEGEHTMLALCRALAAGQDPAGIPGLAFARQGRLVDTGISPRIEDLDALPLPMRDDLPMHLYRSTVPTPRFRDQRAASVSASRGCVFDCSFCTTPYALGRRRIARSVEGVRAELEEVAARHGVNAIYFCDEDFPFDRGWLLGLCDALVRRGPRLSWYCFARATSVEPDLLAAMRAAGCTSIGFGIESPDRTSLRRIGKGVDPERIARALTWVDEAGIWSIGFFMLGLPWHDRTTLREAMRIVCDTRLDLLYPSFATPFPHTRLHAEALARGLLRNTDTDAYSNYRPVMATETLEPEDLQRLHRELMARFYGNPRYLARIARKLARDPVPLMSVLDAGAAKYARTLRAALAGPRPRPRSG